MPQQPSHRTVAQISIKSRSHSAALSPPPASPASQTTGEGLRLSTAQGSTAVATSKQTERERTNGAWKAKPQEQSEIEKRGERRREATGCRDCDSQSPNSLNSTRPQYSLLVRYDSRCSTRAPIRRKPRWVCPVAPM